MRISVPGILAVTVSALFMALPAGAHFRLLQPASWIEEDEFGNPQKIAPCGGTLADGGTRTGAVTQVRGGELLDVVIDETIYHPGHYRISLARKINWLPADTEAVMVETERGPRSGSFPIDENPMPPVLMDGVWENYERRTGIQEIQVEIPNIDCDGCFLQVVQFMANHRGFAEGGFTYHHCAVLDITANPDLPVSSGWQRL